MARRQRVDPYLSQAQLEASLQIDPQVQALAALLSGQRGDYINTRRVNASNARGITEASQRASTGLRDVYGAQNPQQPAAGGLLAAMMTGATTPEGQAAYQRMLGEYGQTQQHLADQGMQAQTAATYANQQARDDYLSSKEQINNSYQDLLAQSGKLTAATYGKLLEARRQRATTRRGQDLSAANQAAQLGQSERNSIRSSGIDPDTGKPIPGGKADPKAKPIKLQSDSQHEQAATKIQDMARWAAQYRDKGLSRHEAAQKLQTAINDVTVATPDGSTQTVRGRPAYNPDIYMTAALDVAYDKHLARKTQKRLQREKKYSIRKLGLPSYGDWLKTQTNAVKGSGVPGTGRPS
jgi:hypothetical protein